MKKIFPHNKLKLNKYKKLLTKHYFFRFTIKTVIQNKYIMVMI